LEGQRRFVPALADERVVPLRKRHDARLDGDSLARQAIADVYDALVSKRAYKEAMSFEAADALIMEGMGAQFDPSLERFYVAARPSLEAYYTEIGAE